MTFPDANVNTVGMATSCLQQISTCPIMNVKARSVTLTYWDFSKPADEITSVWLFVKQSKISRAIIVYRNKDHS